MSNYEYLGKFQSTLPREERLILFFGLGSTKQHFNPRSHERSDSKLYLSDNDKKISIHAPTRGAT